MSDILGTNPATPPPRNLTKEFNQTLQGFLSTAPGFYNLSAQYDPLYARTNLDIARQNLVGFDVPQPATSTATPSSIVPGGPATWSSNWLRTGQGRGSANQVNESIAANPILSGTPSNMTPGHHPGLIELASLQRGADIADVLRYGPSATAAFLRANPFLSDALFNLEGRMADSPVLSELNQQALTALKSGGQLSAEDERNIQQAARASFAARGQAVGDPAIASEILNRDAAVRARMATAQQFASGVEGMNQNQASLVGNAARTFSSTLTDPFQAVLSRPAQTQVPQITQTPNFSPSNAYSQDLFNTNYNAQAASNIAAANNNAALWGALIKSVGQVAGAAAGASDRRLKKNIKYTGEKTENGVPIAEFEYKSSPQRFRGVIADDVEKKVPRAVKRLPGKKKYRVVDFSALTAPFEFAAA